MGQLETESLIVGSEKKALLGACRLQAPGDQIMALSSSNFYLFFPLSLALALSDALLSFVYTVVGPR